MTRRKWLTLAGVGGAAFGLLHLLRPVPSVARLVFEPSGRPRPDPLPPHHDPAGGFRNPWPTAAAREDGGFWRWQRERRQKELAPDPAPESLPRSSPDIVYPRASADDLRVTWVGHATFLIQIGGFNILTDPQWSRRASPVQFAGPRRFTPPGVVLA